MAGQASGLVQLGWGMNLTGLGQSVAQFKEVVNGCPGSARPDLHLFALKAKMQRTNLGHRPAPGLLPDQLTAFDAELLFQGIDQRLVHVA